MVNILGAEIEPIFLGLVVLTLFATGLFVLIAAISNRQYRILREKIDAILAQWAGEKQKVLAEVETMEHKIYDVEQEVRDASKSARAQGLPEDLIARLDELDRKQAALEALAMQVENDIRNFKPPAAQQPAPAISKLASFVSLSKKVTEIKKLERELEEHKKTLQVLKERQARFGRELHKHELMPIHSELAQSANVGSGQNTKLLQKVGRESAMVKKIEREVKLQRSRMGELSSKHEHLSREFHKHEITPLSPGDLKEIEEEVIRAFDELINAESKLNSLSRKVARTRKKAIDARKLAETEPKKRVPKRTFRRTVRSIRRAIGEISPAKKRAKARAKSPVPAPTEVTIQSPGGVQVSVENK